MPGAEVEIEGRHLKLSNLDKVLYPAAGFTKAAVIDYYIRIAPVLLPHLRGRPLTRKRYPDGVHKEFFYEKDAPSHTPSWVETFPIFSESNNRGVNYVLVNDLPTLVWVANLASLELHTLLARAPDIQSPTMVVFDLDPGDGAGIPECSKVAVLLRETFESLRLESFAKTSGSKGMQVYVPLNTPTSYDQTKPFANAIARIIEGQHPKLVTSNMRKDLRKGKVFIDWSQNHDSKTTVSVYSLRARPTPTVSAPVSWDEVAHAARGESAQPLSFTAPEVLSRIDDHGDLFAPVEQLKQRLPDL